jgi:hypothetical protein
MSDTFRNELRKFDAQRVLPAWDGLVREQQSRLEALKVPTMFVTDDADDTEVRFFISRISRGNVFFLGFTLTPTKQHGHILCWQKQLRVVHVLEGILPTTGPDR